MNDGLLERFSERRSSILDEIAELVEIESPSGDSQASSRIASLLEAKFKAAHANAKVERHKAEGVGEHLIVRLGGKDKATLLLGHTDTVHPVGTIAENRPRIENGRSYGPGIFDMKGNIPLILEAFRFLQEKGLERDLTVLLSCDEEIGSASGRPFVERESANAARCFVLEPSAAGKAKTGRKGTAVFRLEAVGVPAHAGLEPERGANAVAELARQIDRIHELSNMQLGTTVNVTTFSGGTTTNVIPAFAKCEIDVRFSSLAEGERVQSELRSLGSTDPRVKLEFKGKINRPPLEETAGVLELFETARLTAAELGMELLKTTVGGASDGNFVGALGVPILDGLGIKGDGAHTLDEYIEVEDIPHRAALLTSLLVG